MTNPWIQSTVDRITGKPRQELNVNTPVSNDAMGQMAAQQYAASNFATAPQQPATAPVQQAAAAGVQQTSAQTTPTNYADLFVALNPYKPMTAEERAAEAKRNKRNALFAALSDGFSALSNLYFTTKGAPNAYDGGSNLSGKMYERQRQMMKDREAREKEYLNGYIRALEMDRNKETADRNWKYQMEQLAYTRQRNAEADKRAADKEKREQALAQLDLAYKAGLIEKQEYDKQAAAIKAQYAPAYEQSRINRNNRTGSGRTSTNNTLWTYPIGDEDIELPKTFWSNVGEVNMLYGRLPQDVRDKLEHEYTSTGRVKKDIKLSQSQKVQAIKDYATEDIKNILRSISEDFGGRVNRPNRGNSNGWSLGNNNNSNGGWSLNK